MIGDRNSKAAADFAAKKKEQLERANKMRLKREQDWVNANDGPSHSAPISSSSQEQRNVFIQSFSDLSGQTVAEKITIRPTLQSNNVLVNNNRSNLMSNYALIESNQKTPAKSATQPPSSFIVPARNNVDVVTVPDSELVPCGVGSFQLSHPRSNSFPSRSYKPDYTSNLTDINTRTTVVNVSDRPLMCMSVHPILMDEVVVGGTDHACYSIPMRDPRAKTMYTKTAGHSEWVTSVSHLPSNQVVSVGMDNKICVWSSSRVCTAQYTDVHFGSISKVLTDTHSSCNIALTSGYDGKINILSFTAGPSASGRSVGRSAPAPVVCTLTSVQTNNQPIIDMTYNQGHVIAGTRDGGVLLWDIHASSGSGPGDYSFTEPVRRLKGHSKSVTTVHSLGNSQCFMTGGADGLVKLYDGRAERCCVMTIEAHTGAGAGAGTKNHSPTVTCLLSMPSSGSSQAPGGESQAPGDMHYIVSGGSDSLVNVMDIRTGSGGEDRDRQRGQGAIVHSWEYHKNGVYSMCCPHRGVVLSGDGAGMMHCYDIYGNSFSGSAPGSDAPGVGLRYGVGVCEQGAVQCISVLEGCKPTPGSHRAGAAGAGVQYRRIVCAGDDGNVCMYDY